MPYEVSPPGAFADRQGVALRLIERMAKGEDAALAELHEFWAPTLLGVACRMLGDRHEAEEVVQDVFVRMWHRSVDYDGRQAQPFVWAFTILRGLCVDRLRFRHREKRDSSKVVPLHVALPPEQVEAPLVMAADDRRRVMAALQQLDRDERSCLELAVFLEYSHSEISRHLSTPLGTVKNRLRRAMEKLRKYLSKDEF